MVLFYGRNRAAVAVLVMCVMAAALVLPATQVASPASAEDVYHRMVVGVAQKPDTLNVFAMTLSMSYTINFLVYDTLNSIEPDFSPGPQLADSWEASEDGLVWTFYLNEDAVWHDGVPVTAEDVKFTLDLVIDNPKDAALWIDYLSNVTDVSALDDHTVQITTEVPKATMLSMMVPILPKHIWSDVPAGDIDKVDPWNPEYFPDGPIGSGPLTLEKWDSVKGEIIMLKNPDYFIDTVKVDEVLWKTYGDETVMVNALWSGDVDVAMDVPASLWSLTLAKSGLGGQATGALSFYELGFNCASAEWREAFPKASTNLETTNLSVRQAVAMCTDKTDIVTRIMEGKADPGESIIPTATPFWHYTVPDEDIWDYHPERAEALLNAAGYTDTDGDGIRQNSSADPDDDDAELAFDLHYRKGYNDEKKCAEAIKENLDAIGMEITLKEVSEGVLWNVWLNLEWDLFIWGWDTDVDPNFMLSVFTEAQYPVDPKDTTKWGDALWINAEYEALYIEQQKATDLTERQVIVHKMQEMLYYHCPYVVLYYPMGLHAYDNVTYTNFPDMVKYPGATPGTMWFFFSVTPSSEYVEEFPPENVDAGPDQKAVLSETLGFSGYAEDRDDLVSDLNWSWSFAEPDLTMSVKYGQHVSYTFEQLGNVTVTLIVTDPSLRSGSDSLVVNVTEMSGTAGWLKGVVKDQDSAPMVGATIDIEGEFRTTLSDGSYSKALEPDEYVVVASKTGFSQASETVTVVTGETVWANFTLGATAGVLKGTVKDVETGAAIESATVTVTIGTGTRSFNTNSEGYYQFDSVPEGTVNVTVSKTGYETNESQAVVVAGETTTHDVALTPADAGGGVSTAALAAVGILVLVVVGIVAVYMLRKKKSGGDMPPPEGPPTV